MLILVYCLNVQAQQTNNKNTTISTDPDSVIYTIVQEMPTFGSDDDLQEYIHNESKIKTSLRSGADTKNVFLYIVVEKNGQPTFDKIGRGYSERHDQEAIRVIQTMPKWNPGKLNDSTFTRVVMLVPFFFVE